jgi:hypothetical protein
MLYQLSYTPAIRQSLRLSRLFVLRVLVAAGTELGMIQPVRVQTLVLLGCVIPHLAIDASKDHQISSHFNALYS